MMERSNVCHLYLSLKRLNIIDDFVEHTSLASDLVAPWYQILQILHSLANFFPPYLHDHK